jgi:hypothetical protein
MARNVSSIARVPEPGSRCTTLSWRSSIRAAPHQGEVDVAVEHAPREVGARRYGHVHGDAGRPAAELREQRRQDVGGGGEDAEVQRAVVALAQRVEFLGQHTESRVNFVRRGEGALACRGQLQPPPEPVEHRHAERLFQLLDLLRHAGAGHEQAAARLCHGAGFGHGL